MRTLRSLIVLSSVALAAGACGSTDDPFVDSNDTGGTRDTGTTDTGGAADVAEDTTTPDATADTVEEVFPDAPDATTDAGPQGCGEGVVFTGQAFVADGGDPLSPNGGAPRFEPWDASYDAGIAALIAAAPGDGDDPVVGEWTITDATVVATDFNSETTQRAQRVFYLADAGGTIQTFFDSEDLDSQPSFSIKVGQRVSGTVTSLGNFNGINQINVASDWSLESEDNEVYIRDIGDEALTLDDLNSVVRVTGIVDSVDNPECGGSSVCYVMTYGTSQSVILRSSSTFLAVGNCVTYVGPVRAFAGVPQLDTLNFDWLWIYSEQ